MRQRVGKEECVVRGNAKTGDAKNEKPGSVRTSGPSGSPAPRLSAQRRGKGAVRRCVRDVGLFRRLDAGEWIVLCEDVERGGRGGGEGRVRVVGRGVVVLRRGRVDVVRWRVGSGRRAEVGVVCEIWRNQRWPGSGEEGGKNAQYPPAPSVGCP